MCIRDRNITKPVGSTTLTSTTGIVAFDKTEGEIDLDFEDAVGIVATYSVDVSGQGKLNLAWNTSFDKKFGCLLYTSWTPRI